MVWLVGGSRRAAWSSWGAEWIGYTTKEEGSDMRSQHAERQVAPALTLTVALALVLLVAGCGQAGAANGVTGGTLAQSSPASRATATKGAAPRPTTSRQKFGGDETGCPATQAPADAAAFTPDVIVSQPSQATGAPQPVTLARGQRLEVRLLPTYSWQLSMADPTAILAEVNPPGWYDSAVRACIWRFTARGTGSARLTFAGAAVCPPLQPCPSVEQTVIYAVTAR